MNLPVVGWGNDLAWDGDLWNSRVRQKHVADSKHLRLNSYRVLLPQGRDGFVVFVPLEKAMETTAAALRRARLLLLEANETVKVYSG